MGEQVGVVDRLTVYPLTGARGNRVDEIVVGAGGIVGDHVFVLYEEVTNASGEIIGRKRVSQKQEPSLAQLNAEIGEDGNLSVWQDPELVTEEVEQLRLRVEVAPLLGRVAAGEAVETVDIDEFEQMTPCYDMGDDAARAFSAFLGRTVRLGRKTEEYLAGGAVELQSGEVVGPEGRKVATLHIGVKETVDKLRDELNVLLRQKDADSSGVLFEPDRLRAQIVLGEFDARDEDTWVGGQLVFETEAGEATVHIDRETVRCPVPGIDQETGVQRNDIQQAYRLTTSKQAGRKPAIGVYGHKVGDGNVRIRRGDRVHYELAA